MFKDLIRVFVKGGIISPGDFLKIILVAEKLGATYLHFGSRQDILFPAKERNKEILDKTFQSISTDYEVNTTDFQNITSSYVALDILPSKKWLASHVYHYILDSFDYRPKLKINLVDPSQSLVPLFTGQVNFVASNQENYWYVYLRFRHLQEMPWQMPMLLFSEDLCKLAKAIEESPVLAAQWTYAQLYEYLSDEFRFNTLPITEDLLLPDTNFPYYEGINRLPDGKYWLGLYWRNNEFKTSILKAIFERCLGTEVGKVCLTPWKSFIIKGIEEKDIIGWEKLMGKFGMNLRHSSLEMNWHIPALDKEALELKTFLVREMDKQDISTYGLTFSIKNNKDFALFTSIVIERNWQNKSAEAYNLLYSKDFNPNLADYRLYAGNVDKAVITPLLMELSLLYYESLADDTPVTAQTQMMKAAMREELYQCGHCLTVYDPAMGDEDAGARAGTPFDALPTAYKCPVCGNGKEGYALMKI